MTIINKVEGQIQAALGVGLLALAILGILILHASGIIQYATDPGYRAAQNSIAIQQAEYQAQQRIARHEAMSQLWDAIEPFIIFSAITLVLGAMSYAAITAWVRFDTWYAEQKMERALFEQRGVLLIHPDQHSGTLPFTLAELQGNTNTMTVVKLGAITNFQNAQLARAENSYAVPHSYAPKITHAKTEKVMPAQIASEAAKALPDVVKLSDLSLTPGKITLGLGLDGKPISLSPVDIVHMNILGATGNGKTNLQKGVISQLLAGGFKVDLLNPHFTTYDAKTGEDWRQIASHSLCTPIYAYNSIEASLKQLVNDELPHRLALYRAGQDYGEPQFTVIDELPAIASQIDELPGLLSAVLREGRKVGLFLIAATQSMLIKDIGGSTAGRSNFRSKIWVGGDDSSARSMLGITAKESREILGEYQLGKGVSLIQTVNDAKPQLARIPLVDDEGVLGLFQGSSAQPVESANTGEEPQRNSIIKRMLRNGASNNKIAQTIGGNRQQALRDINTIKGQLCD